MVDGCGFQTAGDESHGLVLDGLKFGNVRWLAVGEPDCGCKAENGFHKCLKGQQESLLVVAPRGSTDCLHQVQAL
jgi:hypothetical protein